MLDNRMLFQANDELALLNAISMTEVTGKKCELYSGLAEDKDVRAFFLERSAMLKKVSDNLRKHLERIEGGS